MAKNAPYDVREKGFKIRSYNHQTGKAEMRKILSLVRKDDAEVFELVTKAGDVLLKCSGAHRIWDEDAKAYRHVNEIVSGVALNKAGEKVPFQARKTGTLMPIVDLEVEGNANYFTNGILSHNTTTGGRALEYYASIRLKFTKLKAIEEGTGENKEKSGVRTRVEAVKNKTAAPFRRGEFIITFGKGIDDDAMAFQAILDRGLVEARGGGNFYLDGERIARGQTALKEYFAANPAVYESLKAKLQGNAEKPPQTPQDGAESPAQAETTATAAEPAPPPEIAEEGEV